MNCESALTRASSLISGIRGFAFSSYCFLSMTVAFQLREDHLGLITYLLSVRAENTQAISSCSRSRYDGIAPRPQNANIQKKKRKEKRKEKNTNNNKNIDAIQVRKNGNLIGIVYSKLLVRLCGLVNS